MAGGVGLLAATPLLPSLLDLAGGGRGEAGGRRLGADQQRGVRAAAMARGGGGSDGEESGGGGVSPPSSQIRRGGWSRRKLPAVTARKVEATRLF